MLFLIHHLILVEYVMKSLIIFAIGLTQSLASWPTKEVENRVLAVALFMI